MKTAENQNSIYGVLSPGKLFLRCAVPNMISMAVTALYTITDGIFVGRFLGSEALAAVNLVMPLIIMTFALSDMIAVGSSVQIAIRLGEGDVTEASKIFSFSSRLIFLISLFIGTASYLFAGPLVGFLGASGEVSTLAVSYMQVYALFSPLTLCYFAVDNYLRICGKIQYSMVMNVVTSLANIVLDFLFLAVFQWGIASAAAASCLCFAAGSLISYYPFFRKKLVLRFVKGNLSLRATGNIMINGCSELFSNIASSVCMLLFNAVLIRISGYLAVAAFGIVMYIDSVVKSILYGMSDALQPAISYNYGAKKQKRIFAIERFVQLFSFLLSAGTALFMITGAKTLTALFTDAKDPALLAMSTNAMQLFAISYLVGWCGIALSSFFTATNRPLSSLLLSLNQTLVFPVLGLAILPRLFGLKGVWLSPTFSGTLSLGLAAFLFYHTCKKDKAARKMADTGSAPVTLYFKPVTKENWQDVLNLKTGTGQEGFVESVEECLKEAETTPCFRPVGIYDNDLLIGFAMYGLFWQYFPFGRLWLDRLLIDEKYQNMGYGYAALFGLIKHLKKEYPRRRKIYLSVVEQNKAAIHLYQKFGFRFTGELDTHEEKVMVSDTAYFG